MDIKIKCPGQDAREFDPGGVREHPCPKCGREVEFFPDDRSRKCPACGVRFRNPEIDLGCAAWCRFAKECVDFAPTDDGTECPPGPNQEDGEDGDDAGAGQGDGTSDKGEP